MMQRLVRFNHLYQLMAFACLILPMAVSAGPNINLTLNTYDRGFYGQNVGSNQHANLVRIRFTASGQDLLLHAMGFDIDSESVAITLNGKPVGLLPAGADAKYSKQSFWWLPTTMQIAGRNTIVIRRSGGDGTWGVRRLGVFQIGDRAASFGELRQAKLDRFHWRGVRIYLPDAAPEARLRVRYYDVDSDGEIITKIDGVAQSTIASTSNNKWSKAYEYAVNDARAVEFTNRDAPQKRYVWGVRIESIRYDAAAGELPGLTSISGAQWDEAAVHRVLHLFAYGGHASATQVKRWANMSPRAAINQMLTFEEHNALLSPQNSRDRDDLLNQAGTLRGLSKYWSAKSAKNPVPEVRRDFFGHDFGWGPSSTWAQAAIVRGLNPFRQKIGLWETNHHMVTNQRAGVEPQQMFRYYDDIMSAHQLGEPYHQVIALAARSAAVARQYGHEYSYCDNDNTPVECSVNEDFAREFYQLFFGILGADDPQYHETVTIKNMALALTDMPVAWLENIGRSATTVKFGSRQHYKGQLELLGFGINGGTAAQRINRIAQRAINHEESLDSLPITIIKDLADDAMSEETKQALRTAWRAMPSKNLLQYLRAYAISKAFHNPDRIKHWSSVDRNLLISNALHLSNSEVYADPYYVFRFHDEGETPFEPAHNVFGAQTGLESADSANVFQQNYNRSVQDIWTIAGTGSHGYGPYWKKNWATTIPRNSNGDYRVADVSAWLWSRFIGDSGKHFGALERGHIYALLSTGKDLSYLYDNDNATRLINTEDLNNDAALKTFVRQLGSRKVLIDSGDVDTRERANWLVGKTIAFIVATPYMFYQEGQ